MKCFRYNLNQNNQGPAGVLPSGSITGLVVNDVYYGAALIDDLSVLSDWNAEEITSLQFNTICVQTPTEENPNPSPALVQLESQIRNKYADMMNSVVSPYLQSERETWFVQVEEAKKFINNPFIDASEIPMITALSLQREETLENVSNTILSKNAAYRTAVGNILGEQQKLIETIWKV